ncbi:MAG: TolC family protein [Verrucomicrobia bacterium]|nr:TolC family protein [Verrucomicrobiota bacterium]
MSRLLRFSFLATLISGLSVVSSGATDSSPTVETETALLMMPETLIEGLQPLTAAALESSPRVIHARLDVLAAEAREEETRSVTRPRVDVFLDAAARENATTSSGSFQTYYNVAAEQPLWHWNALDNQKRLAKIQRQLAENDGEEARRSLVVEIRQRYLDLIMQKLQMGEIDAAYARQNSHLGVSREQAARGELSADVVATEQLDLRTTEVARDRRRTAFQRSLREFAVLNGLASFSAEALPDGIPGVPANAVALFNPAPPAPPAAGRVPAALARAEGELASARLNQEITRVRMRPMVNLAAGANQDQTSGADQTAVVSYFAGLRVRWDIFDGFATRAAVKQARVAVRQSEKTLVDARVALANQLADGVTDVLLAARELQIAEDRFALTLNRQRVDQDLWKSGQLADSEWRLRQAAAVGERTNLFRLRGQLMLQLAEQELLRQRATKPSNEIPFP